MDIYGYRQHTGFAGEARCKVFELELRSMGRDVMPSALAGLSGLCSLLQSDKIIE